MILCLGPHRSGTSAVTAAIAVLGADLGFAPIYANFENKNGFFEHPELIALNERLLRALGGAWDSASFNGARAIAAAGAQLDPLRAEANLFLKTHFSGVDCAVLKDPRLCLLLDFWLPVIRQAGFVRIDVIHVLRPPLEAALSQQKRVERNPDYYEFGRTLPEGAALWLSYMGQMWNGFEQTRHLVQSYDALMRAPEASLQRLGDFLGLVPDPARLARFAQDFLDPALRSRAPDPALQAEIDALVPQAQAVFHLIAGLGSGSEVTARKVARVGPLFARASGAVLELQSAASARLANRKRQVAADLSRTRDLQAEAEKAAAALRAEDALRQQAFLGEQAKLQAELKKRAAEIEDLVLHREALLQDRARVVQNFQAELAGANAQRADDQLIFQRDLDHLRALEASAKAELAALLASRSWRLTAPVRSLGRLARRAGGLGAAVWVRFNHLARRLYHGLSKRAPWLAEGLRRVAVPLIRVGNRAILKSDYVPSVSSFPPLAAGQTVFQFDYQRPQVAGDFRPLVTILVPNFNHAVFLRQRLDSIFAQSWTHYEVILMDDCSSDDSRAILREYAERYPEKTRLIFNEVNSGGAFYQWEKGLREARGEVIWVAESDDWCSPNFLETLVPFFANPAVQLAYAPSTFMNHDGSQQVWSMAEYMSGLDLGLWTRSFVMTAPQIVRAGFAEKNLIPNVSSAVFRRLDRLEVLENEVWRGMRTCGDWVFYLNQMRGGLVAYSPDAQNFYRQHPANTSVTSFSQDRYYIEHEAVAKCVQRHYSVDPSVFHRQHQNLILHWTRNRASFVRAEFDACYALPRIFAEAANRKPKLLMAGFAFCSGGGETFPITLANVMKTAGFDVTFLNCMQEPDIEGIRNLLAKDIPVVSNFEDLNGLLHDFDIDVIHSHHAWVDNTILDILPASTPVKTVITMHGMYETLPDEQLLWTLPRLVKRTSAMVYIAEKNIEALVSRGLAKVQDLTRIDNALALGPVTPVDRATLGIEPEAFVMTVVSRAIAPKGWQEAIEATARAREISGKDLQLILVGDGPEYDRLLGQVPEFVHLQGFRSNTRDYFAAADIGLLPSRFKGESFPLVIIDCLLAGRPVLASDLGEISYMLTTPDGMAGSIFALEDWQIPIETLARQLADLASNPAKLAAMRAQVPHAAERFDPDLMRERYARVYTSVCKPLAESQAAE